MAYGFNKKDAGRIASTVKRVEHSPLGNRSYRGRHKTRGGGSSGTTTVAIKITTKTNYNTYTADIYGDGLDQAATVTGETIRVLDIATTETIPTGTILFARPLAWEDLNTPGERKNYYTVDPARSY